MKKFIINILSLSLCGVMLISGCSKSEDIDGNVGNVSIETGDTYAVISVEEFGDIKIKLFPEAAPVGVENFIELAESGYFEGKNIHRVIGDFMLQGGSLNGDGTGGTAADGGEFAVEANPKMRHFYGALCYANAAGSNTCQFYIVNNKQPQGQISEVYTEYAEYYKLQAEAYSGYLEQMEKGSAQYEYIENLVDSANATAEGAELMKETLTEEIEAKYAEVGGVPFLDGGYTVFGQTVEGFDVIDAISAVETELGSDNAQSKPVEDIIIKSVTIVTAE